MIAAQPNINDTTAFNSWLEAEMSRRDAMEATEAVHPFSPTDNDHEQWLLDNNPSPLDNADWLAEAEHRADADNELAILIYEAAVNPEGTL